MKKSIRDALVQFSRNGRWGTCGDCPRDVDGAVYPEFCHYTYRYDHHLDIDSLTGQIKLELEKAAKLPTNFAKPK